jgi:hypothetical protein
MNARNERRGFLAQGWSHFLIVLLAVATGLLYVVGGLLRVVGLESEYHTCNLWRFNAPDGADLPHFLRLEIDLLPPRAICHWEDGYSLNHVPSYVNPGLVILIIMLVATSLVVIVHGVRNPGESTKQR